MQHYYQWRVGRLPSCQYTASACSRPKVSVKTKIIGTSIGLHVVQNVASFRPVLRHFAATDRGRIFINRYQYIHRVKNMCVDINEHGQPVGPAMPDWSERPLPTDVTLQGRSCRLEPLDLNRHGYDLYAAYASASDGRDWTYLPVGPFGSETDFLRHIESAASSLDPKHFAVVDAGLDRAVGTLSLMRADIKSGSIEVGWVVFSPLLKRKAASTEAQFLLMQYVFDDLGYRRYEWKCDSLNEPSRNAAERLGFSFEGIFRQAAVYKQRSRDTAWFAITDNEWIDQKKAFEAWLKPENFDSNGRQKSTLTELRTHHS